MERTLSQEERMRRAEEIYNRRKDRYNSNTFKDKYYNYSTENKKVNIKTKLTKKMIRQILICSIIYIFLYVVVNNGYFFSESIQQKINEFLNHDIDITQIYSWIDYFKASNGNIINSIVKETNSEGDNENIEQNETTEENSEQDNEGASENLAVVDETQAVGGVDEVLEDENKSQTDIDVEYIKQNYNIIWPLKGVITSRYGAREATEIVSANHYGLDIAGDIGDSIVSAIDGVVTLASSEGDYGKHIKIENGDVSTLYAHCSTLCVSEGDSIKQGDKIAEVGQTGRATGPHLHFEIRREDRKIDPELILNAI